MIRAEIGKKNWAGRARAKILYFVSDWAEILISFSDRDGPGPKFLFLLLAAGQAEIAAMRAGPVSGLKNPAGADLLCMDTLNLLNYFSSVLKFGKMVSIIACLTLKARDRPSYSSIKNYELRKS